MGQQATQAKVFEDIGQFFSHDRMGEVLVERQVGWIGQRALLISGPLSEGLIDGDQGQFAGALLQVEQSDPFERLQVGDAGICERAQGSG